jgi:uncharacterized protein
MSRVKFYCFLLVLEICFMGVVQAASFDCKKAVTQQDKTICLDPELNRLDTAIANAFKALLKVHPLPDYVKARQTDWQELNLLCDEASLKTCLQNSFKSRLDELNWSSSTMVFSSKKPFNFANADAVVELNPSTKKISIWGGFIEHKQASAESEKPVYVGCQFDGILANVLAVNQPNLATSKQEGDSTQIELKVVGNQLFLTDLSDDICVDKAVVPIVFYRAK